jgi:hypothetical protein
MESELMAVTERLVGEFEQLPSSTVVRVVTDCLEEFSHHDAHFLEQAARARLATEHPPGESPDA